MRILLNHEETKTQRAYGRQRFMRLQRNKIRTVAVFLNVTTVLAPTPVVDGNAGRGCRTTAARKMEHKREASATTPGPIPHPETNSG